MNCAQCRELLVGYIEGLLDAQQSEAVKIHLAGCSGCRSELEQIKALQQHLITEGRQSTQDNLENAVMDAIMRKQAFEIRKTKDVKQHLNFWRTFMKNRIAQLAAAAAIIIAVTLAIYYLVGSGTKPCMAWDCIIQPIMDARTAEFDIIVGEEGKGPVIHDMIMGSKIRRTMEGMADTVSIIDLSAAQILTLEPKKKKATYIDLKDFPQIPNYMDQLRGVINMLQENPHFVVDELGEQLVDGQMLYGFRAKHPQVEIVIWVDPATGLPVRIEQQGGQMKAVCKNMRFDVPMDESLFSMDAPEDYKVEQQELNLLDSTEEDFIEGLRIQAEVVGDGQFPDDVSIEHYVKMAPTIGEKFDKLNVSDEEKLALGMKLSKGLMFIRFFQGQGKWYYAGKGVKLGDADTPIFWYHPKNSQTWRVIYGDLTVEDVNEQDLPQPVEEEDTEPIGYQQWDKDTFVGTEQDKWHITAEGDIVANSYVTLTKGPPGVSVMPVKLPYGDAVLESANLADTPLAFTQTAPGRYEVNLPLDKMQTGETEIEFVWTLPLSTLPRTQEMFRTELASLIPVGSYKLTVALDEGCGFVSVEDPNQSQVVPFSWGADEPKSYFGSCGIGVRPKN
jgi:hypothetical protein